MMSLSALGSAVAAYILWGFAHNLGLIYAFAVVFGLIVSTLLVSVV